MNKENNNQNPPADAQREKDPKTAQKQGRLSQALRQNLKRRKGSAKKPEKDKNTPKSCN